MIGNQNYIALNTNENIIKLNRIITKSDMPEYFDIIIQNFSKKLISFHFYYN